MYRLNQYFAGLTECTVAGLLVMPLPGCYSVPPQELRPNKKVPLIWPVMMSVTVITALRSVDLGLEYSPLTTVPLDHITHDDQLCWTPILGSRSLWLSVEPWTWIGFKKWVRQLFIL